MSFPSYTEYKDSKVEWLGEVPAHWMAASLKRGFVIAGGSTPNAEDTNWGGEFLWATPADLSGLGSLNIANTKRTLSRDGFMGCGCSLLPSGSIILSTRAPIGSLAINVKPMSTNQGCKGLIPSSHVDSGYFAYVLVISTHLLNNLGKGTTFLELSGDDLGRFHLVFPSKAEQTQIAQFLDHETAKIDTLIHEQKRLIELLKEKRQAVISHAVTKGLDPDVPMKDSGVEWLGEVPAHWTVMRLKYSKASTPDSLRAGPFGSSIKGDDFLESSNYRVYNQASIISGDFSKSAFVSSEKFEELSAFRVNEEDVLITTRGTIGRIAIAPSNLDQGVIHPCLIRLRLSERGILGEFLKLVFEHTSIAIEQLRVLSNATTIDVIYSYNLEKIWLPVPPIGEQVTILEYTSKRLNQLDNLSNELARNLTLLKERRSALISAAVTGKIDVRNWQPPADESTFDEKIRQAEIKVTA
jgi:type I restriction enzyme S subunit